MAAGKWKTCRLGDMIQKPSEVSMELRGFLGFSGLGVLDSPNPHQSLACRLQVRSTTTFCDVGARSEKFEPMVYLTLPIPGQDPWERLHTLNP